MTDRKGKNMWNAAIKWERKEEAGGMPYTSATDDLVPGEKKKPNTFNNCKLGCSPLRDDTRLLAFSSDCSNLTTQLNGTKSVHTLRNSLCNVELVNH